MFRFLRLVSKKIRREIGVYQLVLKDKRTPLVAKFLLGFVVFYFFLPFDLIPDFIPILGSVDDVIIIPLVLVIAIRLVPKEVLSDCRRRISTGK